MRDLDAVQAGIERWNGLNTEDATALVAELRIARQVLGPAKAIYEDGAYDPVLFAELGTAIDAYDKSGLMAAHLTRDGGGPPPSSRNEVLLREAVDRLRLQLDAARAAVEALRSAPMPFTEESRQVGAGFLRLFDAWLSQVALPTLNAYDKAMGGK